MSLLVRRLIRGLFPWWTKRFTNSQDYWIKRYKFGGHSGSGSRGESAEYKAGFVNNFVAQNAISSLVELGCGDGQNCSLFVVPRYIGLDISADALKLARQRCAEKQGWYFADIAQMSPEQIHGTLLDMNDGQHADAALSMDVILHLVEDPVFEAYLDALSRLSDKWLIVYSSDSDDKSDPAPHVRYRHFSSHLLKRGWRLDAAHENPLTVPEHPDFKFHVFRKTG